MAQWPIGVLMFMKTYELNGFTVECFQNEHSLFEVFAGLPYEYMARIVAPTDKFQALQAVLRCTFWMEKKRNPVDLGMPLAFPRDTYHEENAAFGLGDAEFAEDPGMVIGYSKY